MIDEQGVLRDDGRIVAAKGVSVDVKFPVVLPRKQHSYYRMFLHGNFQTVVNEIRQ